MIDRLDGVNLVDGVRVLFALPKVELGRRLQGPAPLVSRLRAQGRQHAPRKDLRRAGLRRIIAAIDRLVPGGENCYRRALLEIALDPDAAEEPFSMGLAAAGGQRSGHAWLGHERGQQRTYDAVVTL